VDDSGHLQVVRFAQDFVFPVSEDFDVELCSLESACNVAAQGYNCTTLTAPIREAHLNLCLFLLPACSCAGFAQNLRHFSTGEE
jgi:hypothetical protein